MDELQTYRPNNGTVDVPWLLDHPDTSVVDVRSPGEYAQGHIPGAVSAPLFSDDERAIVGTLYKQQGRAVAIERGLEFATEKADALAEAIADAAGESPFVIHCWRGGMRSRGVARLCDQRNLKPQLLNGGYKSFRQAALKSFEQHRNIILLAGKTGTGKTILLQKLSDAGEQMIDLEGLAVHRGSVFGAIPGRDQPTTEQFENLLFPQWHQLDPLQPVWIEGENQAIGRVHVPQHLFEQMVTAPIALVEADRGSRIEFLLKDYEVVSDENLIDAVQRLKKRLGGLRLQQAIDAIHDGNRQEFANLTLDYYDKSYGKALQHRHPDEIHTVSMKRPADPQAVAPLIELAKSLKTTTTGR
ncbi:MAG: tRNA 2-selenouridine(34) synthase MnmH [Rubripirellula sp.]|nr:tRNA 2-selenouridine(34) synthase MnmH [Rubripirellula sp.]